MHLTFLTLILASALPALVSANPTISIHNTKPYTLCLEVETSGGWFPTSTVCGGAPGINVAPMRTSSFSPSSNWNGAITPIRNGVLGTRFEINFSDASHPGSTWYDADMELGMSGATLGPSDGRKRINGGQRLPSLAGEQDPLAKANAAWARETNKAALLANPKYLAANSNGRLTRVYHDKGAPEAVQAFFQLEADFNAYMGPGSELGKTPVAGTLREKLNKVADQKAWFVDTQQMTIAIF
ncbi:MAG: hypothetical protein Q9181_003991 [Wetmoreana brouardii]